MRVAFMGTPGIGACILRGVVQAGHDVVGAFCQPDKSKGRDASPAPPPVKTYAQSCGIPICQPGRLGPKTLALLQQMNPDVVVVAAYGKLLPPEYLATPRLGCLNVHASLLPKYRGAAPIQWAIANGETSTGITIMQMDAGLDTGDILMQEPLAIGPDETADELHDRLARLGERLLLEALARLETGPLERRPQDHRQASLAPILTRQDGEIDWSWTAAAIANRARGFHPWPGTFTHLRGKQLKLFPPLRPVAGPPAAGTAPGDAAHGAVLTIDRGGLWVRCGDGLVGLGEVQLEGKRRLGAYDFAQGARLEAGEKMG
jgi:methionyl-tRNA formyltransferase